MKLLSKIYRIVCIIILIWWVIDDEFIDKFMQNIIVPLATR